MVNKRNLLATENISEAVKISDVIIVCLPTPVDEQKTPDYSAIDMACKKVAETLRKESLVIVTSTVGPGIVENRIIPLLERYSVLKAGKDFGVASSPERGAPGKMLENLYSIPRVVGGIDTQSTDVASWLYEAALGVRIIRVSNPKTANAIKLMENVFRDVNIALVNEIALLYEKLGIDTIEVIDACATKYNFMPHYPSAGVGGSCLPQNSYYLIFEGTKVGNIPQLIRLAREINDRMPDYVVELVSKALIEAGKTVDHVKVAILGITYKPNVRDIRLTPMEKVVTKLVGIGARLTIFDPYFKNENVFGLKASNSMEEAVEGSDCVVIGTAHKEFYQIDLKVLWNLCRKPAALVDTCNTVNPEKARKCGFVFRGVGRA
jgi:nucleotide sugar dehydrogenase